MVSPLQKAKKPYSGGQTIITSYFSHSSNTTPEDDSKGFPVQSDHVQAGLMNVGMRVRKSVQEGYKTGTYSALSIFHDSTAPTPTEAKALTQATSVSASRPVFRNINELAPFSGINKVGGLAQQITSPSEYFPVISSQESQSSNVSLESLSAGKRRFDDSDEGDQSATCGPTEFHAWQHEEMVSPTTAVAMPISGRPMAVPRKKRMDSTERRGGAWEQENMDFCDADFLD